MEAPLQSPLFARILAVVALLSPLAWSTPTVTETRPPMFTADRDACFGRVYDAAHLKAHPKQKVSSIHVLRSLEQRREAENWTPDARAESIRNFREDGQASVTAFVNFRDRKGTFHNALTCDQETREGVRCMIECDGGSFRLTRSGANSVLLHNNGFVLVGGCGEEIEEGQERHFDPGADDKVFRLDNRPVAACRAEEQKATPIPAGLPLRERFKEDEQFCFGRDYDAAHLASNPKQMVSQIRVGRLTPGEGTGGRHRQQILVVQREARRLGDAALESQDHHGALRLLAAGSELGVPPAGRKRFAVGLQQPQHPARARPRRRDPAVQSPFRPADRQRMRGRADRAAVPDPTDDTQR